MGDLLRSRILRIALAVLILSVATLIGCMAKREYTLRAGCTTAETIRVWQVSVEQKRSCPRGQPSHSSPLKRRATLARTWRTEGSVPAIGSTPGLPVDRPESATVHPRRTARITGLTPANCDAGVIPADRPAQPTFTSASRDAGLIPTNHQPQSLCSGVSNFFHRPTLSALRPHAPDRPVTAGSSPRCCRSSAGSAVPGHRRRGLHARQPTHR